MDSPSILRSGRRSGLGRDLFLWHGTGNAVFGFCSITLKPPSTHSFQIFPFPYPLVLFSCFSCSLSACSLVFVVLFFCGPVPFNLLNKVISPRYCPLLSPFLNTFTSSPDACDRHLTPHPHSYHIPAMALTLILILTLTSHWFRFPTRGACC